MIKALIIEDEALAREEIMHALEYYEDVDIIDQCGDLFSAMKLIRQHKPDVIFLDIHLPGHDYEAPVQGDDWPAHGFTLLDYMEADEHRPHIIIVSGHSQHALRAFEANVLDFLQKPVQDERLGITIDRIREQFKKADNQPLPYPDAHLERIPCLFNHRVKFILVVDIESVESSPAGVHVVCTDQKYYTELTLKTLLQKTHLIQTHRQYLVNPDWVDELASLDNGLAEIYTRSQKTVPVSRNFRKSVEQALGL